MSLWRKTSETLEELKKIDPYGHISGEISYRQIEIVEHWGRIAALCKQFDLPYEDIWNQVVYACGPQNDKS